MDDIGTKVSMANFPKKRFRGDFGKFFFFTHPNANEFLFVGREGIDCTKETYYTIWNDVEIMFHIAPLLNEEQVRRLIGNDIVVIIFHDDPMMSSSFNPDPFIEMGAVAQVCFNDVTFS
jgi:hypothetical protein